MATYAVLLRGVNVGGKNKVPMAELRRCLEGLGYSGVATLIASGNVVLGSSARAGEVAARIEAALPRAFALDAELVRALVLPRSRLRAVVEGRPEGFGEQPDRYHSDVFFLLGLDPASTLAAFQPREGVDRVWAGNGVIYAERLSARRTQSRLSRIVGTPLYRSMTVRNWNTTRKLLALADEVGTG